MPATRLSGALRTAVPLALLFGALTAAVALRPRWLAVDLDGRVADAVRAHLAGRTLLLDALRVMTWAGHPLVVDALVLTGAALLCRRGRTVTAAVLVVCGLASLLVRELVKSELARPRPPDGFSAATGGSYPSGHTAGAAFLAVAAIVLCRRAWVSATATAYALVVAASRVLLDVHWVSDVVGGLLLGTTFAVLVPWLTQRIGERRPRRSGSALPDR